MITCKNLEKKTEFVAWKPSNRFIESKSRRVCLKPNDIFLSSVLNLVPPLSSPLLKLDLPPKFEGLFCCSVNLHKLKH